ncbi:pyridoxal phosphate-dependent aminotransferase [Patescibacteria group bacterium]|nr:pyridoxal phosphate-dependent aminotransferase [Patescibacteria group bacterium]
MKLSQRIKNTPESPIRKLEPAARSAKARGIKIYHLNIGQPDIKTPNQMVSWLKKTNIHHLAYTESQGNRQLIKSIVKYYHQLGAKDITEDNVIITAGGSEAIQWCFFSICEIGDEVMVFEPFYTNVEGYARMADVKLVPVTCKIENGFHLPSNQVIKSKITKKTKAVYLSNPNNPTGTYYSPSEVKRLYQLCLKNNLYLIVDEVYRDFIYQKVKLSTALNFEKKSQKGRMIIVDSFSKRYSLCGIRVGFMVSRNKELIQNVLKFGQARLAVGDLDQQIAGRMDQVPPDYLKKVKKEYQERREVIYQGLKKIPGAVFTKPEGAFYYVTKLPVGDADKFCEWLLTSFHHNQETVMLAPANGFYLSKGKGKEEVRIAYVIKKSGLRKAMVMLKLAVEKWNRE